MTEMVATSSKLEEEKKESTDADSSNIQKRLMYMCRKGDLEKVRELIKQGASVTIKDELIIENEETKSSGGCFSCGGDEEEDVIDCAPPMTENFPLHVAATNGHVELVEAIVDLGADLEAKNRMGSTALHKAVAANQVQTAEKLIELGASIDTTNNIGNTALHIAVFCGNEEMVKLMLKNGAYAQLHSPNKIAFTPLSYAKQSKKLTELLKGFKPSDGRAVDESKDKAS